MGNTWGKNLQLSIFGESHGEAVGIVIGNLPAGIQPDFEEINKEMSRRAPGQSPYATARQEKDDYEILSGIFQGKTTGAPLCMLIRNRSQRSRDYEKQRNLLRPGHGDYPGHVKYKGFNDYRGGGHFSGRLTAPLVFAGALAKQILRIHGIEVYGRIQEIAGIEDFGPGLDQWPAKRLDQLKDQAFPVLDEGRGRQMQAEILAAKEAGDSVGGVVECCVTGLDAGLGEPFFDSAESCLAALVFSIPGVKGVEFGTGFGLAELRGSEAKDEYYVDQGTIKTHANHNGGLAGGITTGMPLLFRAALKPTASIRLPQRTVNIETRENAWLQIEGRHDPCIVLRALPAVEAAAALVVLDLWLGWGREAK